MTKKEYISKKIKKLMDEGYSQDQAVAISYSMYNNKYDLGGYNERDPEENRRIAKYASSHGISFYEAEDILYNDATGESNNTLPRVNDNFLNSNGNVPRVPTQKFSTTSPFSKPMMNEPAFSLPGIENTHSIYSLPN